MKHDIDLLKDSIAREKSGKQEHDIEALKASIAKDKARYESRPATTFGEDVSNLWEGTKNLGGAALEGVKNVAQNPEQIPQSIWSGVKSAGNLTKDVVTNPKQAFAGVIPGLASTADILVPVANAPIQAMEYLAEKYTGRTIPEAYKTRFSPIGQDIGNAISDYLFGVPQTPEEKRARLTTNIGSSFINPTQGVKEIATKTVSKAKHAPGKVLGKTLAFNPEKYETFEKAGLTPTVPEVSNAGYLKKTQTALENVPFSAGKLAETSAAREKQINSMFESLGNIHQNKPVRKTGEILSRGGKEYNKKAQEVMGKLYDKAWKGIDRTAPVPMPETHRAITDYFRTVGPEAQQRLMNSSTGKEFLKLHEDIISSKGAIPFDDLRDVFHKDIKKGVDMWEGVTDLDQGALKKVSEAISKDMDNFVLAQNPKAAKDLEKANKHYKQYSDRNKEIANKASKEKDPTKIFGEVMSDLKGGDIEAPNVLLKRLNPKDKKTFSEIFNSEIGRGEKGDFDMHKWAAEISRMRPESLDVALSGYPKAQAQQIRELADAINLIHTSKASDLPIGLAFFAGEYAGTNKAQKAKGIINSRIATEIFTNPKVTKAMYDASKANTAIDLKKVIDKYPNILGKLGNQATPALDKILSSKEAPEDKAAYQRILSGE